MLNLIYLYMMDSLIQKRWTIGLDKLMCIAEYRILTQTRARFSWQAYALEALPWFGGMAKPKMT